MMWYMVTKLTGLREAIQLLVVWQTDDGSQRRLDKVMCKKYQIVEIAKRSFSIDLL